NFTERARESRRNRFAAQTLERSNSLLAKQNERVPVDGCSDVDNICSRQICRDRRGPALIYIDGSRNHALNRHRSADLIDGNIETALGKVACFERDKQRQARPPGAGGSDLQSGTVLL